MVSENIALDGDNRSARTQQGSVYMNVKHRYCEGDTTTVPLL